MYFLLFRIFEQLAFALKNRVALEFFTVLKYFLSSRIFEQLALALKTEFALNIFKPGGQPPPPDPPPRTPMVIVVETDQDGSQVSKTVTSSASNKSWIFFHINSIFA